jgi:hypothetical protein
MNLLINFHIILQNEECSVREEEEEVEDAGREDFEVAEWEESSDGGYEDFEHEEYNDEGAG